MADEKERDTTKAQQIIKIYQENPNLKPEEIAKKAGASKDHVRRVLREYKKEMEQPPAELEPLDEMEYLRKIIASSWGRSDKAELVVNLFQDYDPNNLKILYNLLNKAQCPKTASELIIFSWAKHRHISPERVKEMFKNNKSMLRTFKEMGYFDESVDIEEEEEEEEEEKKEEEKIDVSSVLEDLRKEKIMELKRKLDELRLKKELSELEKQLSTYEEQSNPKEEEIFWEESKGEENFTPSQPLVRKVVRPAINPVTGEVLRDDKGNIIFETVEEPVSGTVPQTGMDDNMMRWILALQSNKKEDPEKELLKKEIEELKKKIEESERKRAEEEEKRRYEEQIKQLQNQLQQFQQQVLQQISELEKNRENEGKKSFLEELFIKMLDERGKIPPEVQKIIDEEREIIKKLSEKPKTDEEKQTLLKEIEELKKTLEKKQYDEMLKQYGQYINALYKKIENLEKNISLKNNLSDEKYKIDKIVEMDKERASIIRDIIKDSREGLIEPALRTALEAMRQQDLMNRYMMLAQEEVRRGLPPGTLTDRLLATPKVTEEEKRKILEKIDKELEGE